MNQEAIDALRKIIYHRVLMWDAGLKAEKALGRDIDTQSDGIDGLACCMNDAEDAMTLDEADLVAAFDLEDENHV